MPITKTAVALDGGFPAPDSAEGLVAVMLTGAVALKSYGLDSMSDDLVTHVSSLTHYIPDFDYDAAERLANRLMREAVSLAALREAQDEKTNGGYLDS